MVTLAPAHPVYAAQEDRYERDRQAEAQAGAYFEQYLAHVRRLPIVKGQHELLDRLETEVQDALRDLFAMGWDAARAEQNR